MKCAFLGAPGAFLGCRLVEGVDDEGKQARNQINGQDKWRDFGCQNRKSDKNKKKDSSCYHQETVIALNRVGNFLTSYRNPHRAGPTLPVGRQREFNQLIYLGRLIAVVKGADVDEYLL